MPSGKMNQLAINLASTWGTPVSVNFADGNLFYNSFGLGGHERERGPASEATGVTISGSPNKGGVGAATGDLTLPLHYDNMPRLLNYFGTDVKTGGSAPYTHTITAATTARTPLLTMIESIPNADGAGTAAYRTVDTVAGTGFSISGEVGNQLTATFSLLGQKMERSASETLNATMPKPTGFLPMEAADTDFFAVADQGSGTAPANFSISGFTFSYEIPRSGDMVSTGQEYVGLPDETGAHNCTLEISIPNWVAAADLVNFTSDTPQSANFTFPGAEVSDTACSWKLIIPNMRVRSFTAATDGPDRMNHTISYDCFAYDAGTSVHSTVATTNNAAWQMVILNNNAIAYGTILS